MRPTARTLVLGILLASLAGCTAPEPPSSTLEPCDCSGPDLNCSDFACQPEAQACYEWCISQGFGDVFGLDGYDNDGVACEHLRKTCP